MNLEASLAEGDSHIVLRPPTKEWVDAIAAITHDLGAVHKDQRSGDGYNYRSIDGVINALHPLLAEHHVVIVPSMRTWTLDEWKGYRHGETNPWTRISVVVDYLIVGPDGSSVTMTAVGEGIDNSDKGIGKAMSYAYKAFVSQLFSIPTDDPEMNTEHARSEVPELLADNARKALMEKTRTVKNALGADSPLWGIAKATLEEQGIIDPKTGRARKDLSVDLGAEWNEILDDYDGVSSPGSDAAEIEGDA